MSLTVLSESNVKEILNNLTKKDVEELQNSLKDALHEYSTSTTNSEGCAENQPDRTVIESKKRGTTLFMPSTGASGIGIKVVTIGATHEPSEDISEAEKVPTAPYGSLTLMTNVGKPYGFLSAEDLTAFRTALASSLLFTRRKRIRTLTVFGAGKQAYWHIRLCLLLRGSTIKKVHFINRDFSPRATGIMKSFISFPAATKRMEGWHDTTFDLASLQYGEIGRILKDQIRAADILFLTTPSTEPLFDHTILTNTEGRKRARLIIAVGSYKPHMIELPAEVVSQAVKIHGHGHHFHKRAEEGGAIVVDTLKCLKEAGELVQAGVKADRTVELGELVMLETMHLSDQDSEHSPTDNDDDDSSATSISLDKDIENYSPDGVRSLAKAMRESSVESIGSSQSPPGSKTPSRKSSFNLPRTPSLSLKIKSRASSMSLKAEKRKQTEKEDQLSRWLSGGNVIYKSVGMGLMDLVVGGEIVRIAKERGVGTVVEGF